MQEYFAEVMRFHVLLKYEWELSLPATRPMLVTPSLGMQPTSGATEGSAGSKAGNTRRRWNTLRPRVLYTLAAAVAICCAVGILTMRGKLGVGAFSGTQPTAGGQTLGQCNKTLLVKNDKALRLISQLTRTTNLSRLELPAREHNNPDEIALCRGTAWMERSDGRRERGFMLEVPSHARIELFVDANAAGRNLLSVIKMDESITSQVEGAPKTGALTFDNIIEGYVRSTNQGNGSLGNYSDFNDSQRTLYYLLTGSHFDDKVSTTEQWFQSDYEVIFEAADILVLGWDYSRYVVRQPTTNEYIRDGDYNDLRAIVHLSSPDSRSANTVPYSPAPTTDAAPSGNHGAGTVFDVPPEEILVIVVTRATERRSELQIKSNEKNEVIWLDVREPCRSRPNLIETVHEVYVIRNSTKATRQYSFSYCYADAPSGAEGAEAEVRWTEWPAELLAEELNTETIGFRDPPEAPTGPDYNGISVHARWFSQ